MNYLKAYYQNQLRNHSHTCRPFIVCIKRWNFLVEASYIIRQPVIKTRMFPAN